MEWFLIGFFLLTAAAAIVIPYLNGNPTRKITAAILLLPAAYIGYTEYQTITLENNLSAAIQTYSGNATLKVSCHRFSQYFTQTNQRAGQVWFDSNGTASNTTELMYRTCEALKPLNPALSQNKDIPVITDEQAFALHILSHELQHLQNIKNEAAAECYAHQHNPSFFNHLKISNPQETAIRTFQQTYPNNARKYKSGECKPGGQLDLKLTPSVFNR